MNKDLPLKVRHIFSELDPLVWKGVWLDTLNKLLTGANMPLIWDKLLQEISQNKEKYPSIGNSQFMKWELKAFVAQAVSLRNKNYNREDLYGFEKYCLKGYQINRDVIDEIYNIIS